MVTCLECGVDVNILTASHLAVHGLSPETYRIKHPAGEFGQRPQQDAPSQAMPNEAQRHLRIQPVTRAPVKKPMSGVTVLANVVLSLLLFTCCGMPILLVVRAQFPPSDEEIQRIKDAEYRRLIDDYKKKQELAEKIEDEMRRLEREERIIDDQ